MNKEKKIIIVGLLGAVLLAVSFLLPIVHAQCYLSTPENSRGYVGSGMHLAQGIIVPDENAGLGGGYSYRTLPKNHIEFVAIPLLALLAAVCLLVKGLFARLVGCLAGLGGIAFCIAGYLDFVPPISNDYTWIWGPGYGIWAVIVSGVLITIPCGVLAWLDRKREKRFEEWLES